MTEHDVQRHARQIAAVTASRYMPPWPPAPTSGPFLDERRLTNREIALIAAWVNLGAPSGTDAEPIPASHPDWALGTPDLVVTVNKPLALPAAGPDVFWNFVLKPGLTNGRNVRAVEIQPGPRQLIHHANLLVDRTGSSARRVGKDSNGFGGMELSLNRSPLDPASHFLFWKPGSPPYQEPAGLSWRLNPGNLLVLNTHLQPSGKPEWVTPRVGLYFTDQQPSRFPLLLQLEADRALRIPPGSRDFSVTDYLTLPADADLLAIYPHAHYLGTLLEATALLPDGTRRELIRIPHWNLNWQAVYRYQSPLYLPKGTQVTVQFHYANLGRPPRLVQAGNQASDEMAHLWLQILPRGDGDRRRIFQEALARHRLSLDPRDQTAHLSLGAILLSRLRAQEAIPELRAAVRLRDENPEAHDMLGAALQNTGQFIEAVAEYQRALAIDPEYMSAHYNLAEGLARLGRRGEAIQQMRRVAEAFPADAHIQSELQRISQASPQ